MLNQAHKRLKLLQLKRTKLYLEICVCVHCICLMLLTTYFLSPQPAVRPAAQKAKSPAPQAPGGSSTLKLGPKGVFRVWVCVCVCTPACLHVHNVSYKVLRVLHKPEFHFFFS